MTSLSKRLPIYKQKSHGIEVAVWKREHDDKAFYSISVNRSFRDKHGQWQNSNSFNLEDRDILMDSYGQKTRTWLDSSGCAPATTQALACRLPIPFHILDAAGGRHRWRWRTT
jgi:hypothetical protein